MNLWLFSVFVLICLSGGHAELELIDEDTISITDESEGLGVELESVRDERDMSTEDNADIRVSCKTARGMEGHCKSFDTCYPILALRQPKKGAYTNFGVRSSALELESMLRNITGPCDKQIFETVAELTGGGRIPREEFVCCPSDKVNIKKRPSRPPTSTMSPVKQSCGRVLKIDDDQSGSNSNSNSTESLELDAKIVNGRVAQRGEFPWMVALMNSGRQFCGGSLIDNSHVLTAAHCIHHMNKNDVSRLRIHIGDHDIYNSNDGSHVVRGATNIYYHRGFSMRTLYDDVAVIRLNNPVTFTRYIQPICLSPSNPPYDTGRSVADVCGWGKLSERGQQSAVLRTVSVRVLTQTQCINTYRGKAPAGISQGMVCAGDRGRDSCQGDSGGPLSRHAGGRAEQIGIVSWGVGCGSLPGVYTRVDKYAPWINKNRR